LRGLTVELDFDDTGKMRGRLLVADVEGDATIALAALAQLVGQPTESLSSSADAFRRLPVVRKRKKAPVAAAAGASSTSSRASPARDSPGVREEHATPSVPDREG
jgi:hypothetical protein